MEGADNNMEDMQSKLLRGIDGAGEHDNQNKILNKDLAYVFLQNRDNFPAKPYYEDGNPEMYTQESMQKRYALRSNPTVHEAIKDFMTEFRRNG